MSFRKRGKNWQIEKMYKGKTYYLTIDHKPTKAEADRLIWDVIENDPHITGKGTFQAAAYDYIKSKDAILSPATIRGYETILRNLPYEFLNARLNAITSQRVQILLNDVAKRLNAKTVRNYSGFISSVMKSVNPEWNNNATLPQRKVELFYVPEKDDIKRILDASKNTMFEIPLWLATFGLRRSEIIALEKSDLKDNTITVSKALVPGKDGKLKLKSTKTVESTRKFLITPYVASLIQACPDGRIYQGHPDSILNYLHKSQDRLQIPRFTLHQFRHFFVSTARETMGDVYVEKMGGWKKGSNVMKKVYDYAQRKEEEKAQKEFVNRINTLLG